MSTPASGPSADGLASPAPAFTTTRDRLMVLALGAVGVVYGDVGTSPLYTMREAFAGIGQLQPTEANILGVLSLIFWALTIVVAGKYLILILRADNHGEGGSIALLALAVECLGPTAKRTGFVLAAGLIGTALFYGDSIITPAISVLGAVEGLEVATPVLKPYVIPISVAVLVFLFCIQGGGTSRVGALFGPIMTVWFLALAVLGIGGIVDNPVVILAINPVYAVEFCLNNGFGLLAALSAIVLGLTGAEAIYADMGHFGRGPIRTAWFGLVMPALLLNYFGQGALILSDPDTARAPFFLLAPDWALYPLVGLATMAAIIASQAVITGAYSITRQALLLGFLPRLPFKHTSATEVGQIYMPHVNWILMAAVLGLVLGFQTSSSLAHAYGIAVTGTMMCSTLMAYIVARRLWGWGRALAIPVFAGLFVIEGSFFVSCMTKVVSGGWFPLVVAACVATMIYAWRIGRAEVLRFHQDGMMSLEAFLARLTANRAQRVAGTAIFMTAQTEGVPSALLHNLKHNKVLHDRVVLLTVETQQVPWVRESERISVSTYPHAFYRVVIRYGFLESPNVPKALEQCASRGLSINMMETSFFLGRETLLPALRSRMPRWLEHVFFWLWRNASSATEFFRIPANRVVELGSQVEI